MISCGNLFVDNFLGYDDFIHLINTLISDLDKCNLIICSSNINRLKYKFLFTTQVTLIKIKELSYYDSFTNIVINNYFYRSFC